MQPSAAVRGMIAAAGYTLRDASRAMGKSQTFLGSSLGRSAGLTVETVAAAADAVGWRLVLAPADDLPASALVIDPRGQGTPAE